MYNAGERKDIRAAEKASRIAERQRQDFIRHMMSTSPGRAWVWALLSDCQCFASTFQPDAMGMSFAEGRRSVGLQVLADIMQACPDQYIAMQREANDRARAVANAKSARRPEPEYAPAVAPDAERSGSEEPGRFAEGREYALESESPGAEE